MSDTAIVDEFAPLEQHFEQGTPGQWAAQGTNVFAWNASAPNGQGGYGAWVSIMSCRSPQDAAYVAESRARIAPAIAELRAFRSRASTVTGAPGGPQGF